MLYPSILDLLRRVAIFWQRAEAQLKAGAWFDVRRLQQVDSDVLSEMKRRRENEAAPRFPPKCRLTQEQGSGWKEQQ